MAKAAQKKGTDCVERDIMYNSHFSYDDNENHIYYASKPEIQALNPVHFHTMFNVVQLLVCIFLGVD